MKHALLSVLLLLLCAAGCAETFLVTSDLHLTADGDAHAAALAALRDAAAKVDAVILLGDNTNNAHAEEHARVLAFLERLDAPAYVIPGNHDATREPSDFTERYAAYGWDAAFSRDGSSASCAVMTPGGTCLLLLDTNDASGGFVAPLGGIAPETCAWAAGVLASLPADVPVVACGHHPILPPERWERTPGAEALSQALRGAGLYLCGHDHGFAAVRVDGLQQITVGQPHAYPGWAGLLEVSATGLRWRVLPLYDDATRQAMRTEATALGEDMARGTLAGTVYEGDADAIRWFTRAFDAAMASELTPETCARLLSEPAARKWREIETPTVVKRWIFGLLENCPQDVRQIDIDF